MHIKICCMHHYALERWQNVPWYHEDALYSILICKCSFTEQLISIYHTLMAEGTKAQNVVECSVFTMWCSAANRQRINANGFNAIWFVLLKERNNNHDQDTSNHVTKFNLIKWLLTLFVPILLHHVWFDRSSSSFSMLCPPLLSIDCLSFLFLGIQARPHPLPPAWHPFPQTPGNSPLPWQAHYDIMKTRCSALHMFLNITNLHLSHPHDWRHKKFEMWWNVLWYHEDAL
jgi:hypothetical protein